MPVEVSKVFTSRTCIALQVIYKLWFFIKLELCLSIFSIFNNKFYQNRFSGPVVETGKLPDTQGQIDSIPHCVRHALSLRP